MFKAKKMIRRNFLKVLMMSPLGFLTKKKARPYKPDDKPMYCFTPAGDSNLPFDTPLASAYDKKGMYTGSYWKVNDAKWVTFEHGSGIFTVWKNGKVIRTFKMNG